MFTPAVQSAPVVAAVFCFFYLTTNYVLGSLLLAGILEQFNVKNSEARRLQRRAIVRKLHSAQVHTADTCRPPVGSSAFQWLMQHIDAV